jgi:5'-nucleotidase
MKFLIPIIAIAMILPFHSCSLRKDMSYNQRAEGHYRLYTYPEYKDDFDDQRYQRILLFSLNDFQGNIDANEFAYNDKRFAQTHIVRTGGVAGIKSYLDIIRTKYPGQVLLMDSGSFLNRLNFHSRTIFLYNYLGVDFATLGKNEFLIDRPYNMKYLQGQLAKANFPVVASNLVDLKTGATPDWKNMHQSYIKTINGIKVGVLGITSPKMAKGLPASKLTGYYFQNAPKTIIETAAKLRQEGAQVVIALFNSGLNCTSMSADRSGLPEEKVNFIPEDSTVCENYQNELVKTLGQIPPQTIDAVVTGNSYSKVANFVHGYPVVQNFGSSDYLSWIEIFYDKRMSRVANEKTIIHQPIHICHQHIKKTQDCFAKEEIPTFDLVPAKFMQQQVQIQPIPQ